MSLLSETVSTVASFQAVSNSTIVLGPETVIRQGVNFLTLTGSCTPNALDTNFILLDDNGDRLDLSDYVVMSITISSDPPLVVTETTPTPILFDVVGLDYPLTSLKTYWPQAGDLTVAQINDKRFTVTLNGSGGTGPSEFDNFQYPIPAIRPFDGPGTINSGTIFVSFQCAALL